MSLKNMFQMNQVLMLLELTKTKFKKHMDDMVDFGCLMLATMTLELQKQHENMVAYEMIQNLKEIYEEQARQERYETSKALFQCKMCWDIIRKNEMQRNNKIFMSHQRSMYKYRKQEEELKGLH
ncbi:hypothetical protein V6N12_010383 [Hibiscus sabdariffa]|uniref:Uncharacterized protein n=1 Tax=Hibiscus sabdariffa TaxID=183260 RepID=A0ABR2EJX4_9ROSI